MFPNRSSTVVRNLLIACVGIFAFQAIAGSLHLLPDQVLSAIDSWGVLDPALVWGHGQAWRVFTYMFLHANLLHLFFNMWSLWVFGQPVAMQMGERRFLGLYLFSGAVAGLFSGLFYLLGGSGHMAVVGASGALYGVMLAFARLYPDVPIYLFLVVPVPARIAVWILGAIALLSGLDGGGGVAHLTHLFGILGGWMWLKFDDPVVGFLDGIRRWRETRSTRKAVDELVAGEEFFDSRVDPILRKISKHGMGSLTRQERSILERASGMRKKDNTVDLRAWRRDRE
jgi:membrane associated rhomboid family serine protease